MIFWIVLEPHRDTLLGLGLARHPSQVRIRIAIRDNLFHTDLRTDKHMAQGRDQGR